MRQSDRQFKSARHRQQAVERFFPGYDFCKPAARPHSADMDRHDEVLPRILMAGIARGWLDNIAKPGSPGAVAARGCFLVSGGWSDGRLIGLSCLRCAGERPGLQNRTGEETLDGLGDVATL